MSHIAAALARSKGKSVSSSGTPGGASGLPSLRIGPQSTPVLTAPPFSRSATPFSKVSPTAAAPAPAAPVSRPSATPKPLKVGVVITVVCVILAVAGASAWLLFFNKDNTFASLLAAKPTAPATPPAATSAAATPATASAKVVPIQAVAAAGSPVIAEKVRKLPITAAAGGSSQRLSLGGKIYEPGEMVAEGIILQAIETDEIVFRDVDGNIYTRRL